MGFELGRTKLFADGADREGILEFRSHPLIEGFTTDPTLMRAAGIDDYESFAIDLVGLIPDRPISFEVFSDDADGMGQPLGHCPRHPAREFGRRGTDDR